MEKNRTRRIAQRSRDLEDKKCRYDESASKEAFADSLERQCKLNTHPNEDEGHEEGVERQARRI